jgi:hypothetical protein
MMLFPDHWAHESAGLLVVPTPVGAVCDYCEQPIRSGERGLLMPSYDFRLSPWHRRCLLRNILGPDIRCFECLDMGLVWLAAKEWAPCLCGATSARQ